MAGRPGGGLSGRLAVLQLARASYGVALVMAPGLLTFLVTGHSTTRRERRVAQLLGARHLVQAAVTAFVPVPSVVGLGAAVDAMHAGSMLLLATADPAARNAALTDALAEVAFATAGWSASARWSAPVQAPEGDLLQQQP
jgi:hypothetical protein